MSDIKVGEYIRTRGGNIEKILKIQPYYENDKNRSEYDYISTEHLNQWKRYQLNEIVTKHSFNIIDLIEVGDYVNGYLIDYIDNERRFVRSERPYRENSTWYKDLVEKGKDYNMCLHFKNEDIKSIVTHEQFEQMSYKVKEIENE